VYLQHRPLARQSCTGRSDPAYVIGSLAAFWSIERAISLL
jgi:hypothetical protein